MLKFLLPFFLVFSTIGVIQGQEFGGHPAGRDWQMIDSDSFNLVFPKGLEKKARLINGYISAIDQGYTFPNKRRYRSVPIVLQNRTNISNGYVGMGPWRSEFYITPLQNSFRLGSIPWEAQLALHEYRHVQQYRHFMKGLTGAVYTVLGQDAGSLFSNMAVPNWFWEGDAVFQETSLSAQGRGRIPYFFNNFRANWNAGKDYSWMKIRNGSLRDRIPDHYELGYLLVAYGEERFGKDIWSKVTADAAAYKGVFYPFQWALRKHTGIGFRQFRNDAFQHYKSSSHKQDEISTYAAGRKHFLADHDHPQWLNDSTIIYVKSTYDDIPKFVQMNTSTNDEIILADRFISLDKQFSLRNNRIVYSTYSPDRRWTFWDYSDIVLFDPLSRKQQIITKNKRYFSPDINEKGNSIVTVKIKEDGSSELRLIDVDNKTDRAILSNADFFYTYPKFYKEDSVIVAVRNQQGKMAILSVDIGSGQTSEIIPFSSRIIGFLNTDGNIISFTATDAHSEMNFVYKENQLYKLNTGKRNSLGVYHPAHRNGNWIMQAYSAVGNILFESNDLEPFELKEFLVTDLPGPFENDAWKKDILAGIDTLTDSGILKYDQAKNLFNFHSIRPYVTGSDISISLVSQNVLNNMVAEISGQYNTNEEYKKVGATLTYGGLYPWIRGGLDYTFNRNALYRNSRVFWNEIEPRVGLLLPLQITKGKWYRNFQLGADYVHNKRFIQGLWKDSLEGRSFGYLQPVIRFTSQVQQARKNIYPRFAQNILVNYKKAVTGRTQQQFLADVDLYFPGLFKNHAFVVNAALQARDSGLSLFTNNFYFSRGFESENFKTMYKWGVNYHLPLIYPDKGFASIVYILRVRSNLFFDYTSTIDDRKNERLFRSTGAEIFFDTKWWNQQPISFGIRYSHLLDPDLYYQRRNVLEFVLPVLF